MKLQTQSIESRLQRLIGLTLWAISALLSLSLFLTLGGESVTAKVLMGTVALCLEAGKILTWRKGGLSRLFSLLLVSLSLLASIGAALVAVENAKDSMRKGALTGVKSSQVYLSLQSELKSIDTEVEILLRRQDSLPPDFTTASNHLNNAIKDLRDRRSSVLSELSRLEESAEPEASSRDMIYLLSKAINKPQEAVLFVLLIIVAVVIELGAMLLTSPETKKRQNLSPSDPSPSDFMSKAQVGLPWPSYRAPIDAETFLRTAIDGADLPYLHGRDKTAEKMGISYADAKRIVTYLMRQGRITVEGKRLRLTEPFSVPENKVS